MNPIMFLVYTAALVMVSAILSILLWTWYDITAPERRARAAQRRVWREYRARQRAYYTHPNRWDTIEIPMIVPPDEPLRDTDKLPVIPTVIPCRSGDRVRAYHRAHSQPTHHRMPPTPRASRAR